jgi:hypothetical protein
LAALLVAAAGVLQHERETRYPLAGGADDALYFTSGKTLKHLTEGYNALAADVYWIRAIQYYGGNRLKVVASQEGAVQAGPDYALLYPLLDATTTLDPKFNMAYRFGSIFLAEPKPAGAGRPDLAVALLEKGLAARPDKWEYMQDIGFVRYWWQHDYKAAAASFERAANVPGAPWWLRSLAATTVAEGGDRGSSRVMWEAIRQTADIDWLQRDAERHLLQLRALDDIDALQARVNAFSSTAPAPPESWLALVRARVLPGVPVDPAGTPYDLDSSGRVTLSQRSSLFPIADEPKRLTPSL